MKLTKFSRRLFHDHEIFEDRPGLDRLIFFSDAVFAIAMTLLALDIHLPEYSGPISNEDLTIVLLSLWPKYLSYVISFLVTGTLWLGHHRKFRYITKYDSRLIFINIFLLMVVAFLPFPTTVLSHQTVQVSIIFYSSIVCLEGLLMLLMWTYAANNYRLIDLSMEKKKIQKESLKSLNVPIVFGTSIVLTFINTDLAMFFWIFAAIIPLFV